MVAKQLSIFLENKSGRLTEVTEVLAKEGINLSALCIAENADFGILPVDVVFAPCNHGNLNHLLGRLQQAAGRECQRDEDTCPQNP